MMRSHCLLMFVLALGLASLGCGGTVTTSAETPETPPPTPPKAEVRGETAVTAEDMDFGKSRDFPFIIANTGGSPLELKLAAKSCSCATIDLPATIAAGGEGKMIIHWSPIPGSRSAVTLTADVQTNEKIDKKTMKSLHFEITAHLQPLVRVFVGARENNPDGEFAVDLTVQQSEDLTVFSTKLPAFAVRAECTVPGFEVLPATPLPPQTMVGEYRDVVGYKMEVRTTKDLPLGYSRGLVKLALSNLGSGEPDRPIAIPIVAKSSGGGINIASTRDKKSEFIQFKKPKITDEDAASVLLTMIVPSAKEDVTLESYEPKFLRVDKPERVRAGQWRITAHLPGNDPEAAKLQPEQSMIGIIKLKVAGLDRPVNIQVRWDPETGAK